MDKSLETVVEKAFALPDIAQAKLAQIWYRNLIDVKGHHVQERTTEKSKWAGMVERIQSDPDIKSQTFQKVWKQFRSDIKECHEDFAFNHDDEK